MSLSFQENTAFWVFNHLRHNPKKCPEGLRASVTRLDEYYKNPWAEGRENAYTLLCEFVEALPDYVDEIQGFE